MQVYIYEGNYELGKEPCGTSGKYLLKVKSLRGLKQTYIYKMLIRKGIDFRAFSYSNFYDDKTFKRLYM